MSTAERSGTPLPRRFDRSARARRALDLVLACLTLLLLSPLMAFIALAILIQDGRPILFSQVRIGQHGRSFRIYKFRKFGPDCGPGGCPVTLEADPRITPVGRILEKTKLDEVPQLWNVLRGDMSIVGPRPESLAFADCFADGFEALLEHKPGIFGPCQIVFRNEGSLYPKDVPPEDFYRQALFPAKARIDLSYFPRRIIAGDMLWIACGVAAVLGWMTSLRARRGADPISRDAPGDGLATFSVDPVLIKLLELTVEADASPGGPVPSAEGW